MIEDRRPRPISALRQGARLGAQPRASANAPAVEQDLAAEEIGGEKPAHQAVGAQRLCFSAYPSFFRGPSPPPPEHSARGATKTGNRYGIQREPPGVDGTDSKERTPGAIPRSQRILTPPIDC